MVGIFQFLDDSSSRAISQVFPFHYYTTKDGLPSNEIHVLRQNSLGYLWIGTAEGVSVYDGNTFTNYSVDDGLSFNYVTDIVEDRDVQGTMWIRSADGGLSKFTDGKITRYTFPEPMTTYSHNIPTVMQDHTGSLWCSMDKGVYQIRGTTKSRVHSFDRTERILRFFEQGDSIIWVVSSFSLHRFNERTNQVDSIVFPSVNAFRFELEQTCLDPFGTLWIGANSGHLYEVPADGNIRVHNINLQPNIARGTFTFLFDDGGDYLWAGVTGIGLLRIAKNDLKSHSIVTYSSENGLPQNDLGAFLIDKEKNIWIGTYLQGLVKLTDRYAMTFPLEELAIPKNSYGSAIDNAGHIWLVQPDKLSEVWQDESGSWHYYLHSLSELSPKAKIGTVVIDSLGRLWLSIKPHQYVCLEIIHALNQHSRLRVVTSFKLQEPLMKKEDILCFIVDSHGMIWASIQQYGVIVINPRTATIAPVLKMKEWEPAVSIRAIHEDRVGNVWLGAFDGGLVRLRRDNPHERQIFTTANGLPDNKIRCITEDAEGNILIGTRLGGIAIYEQGMMRIMNTKDGLLSNAVWYMMRDTRGKIWIGNHLGLQMYDPLARRAFWTDHDFFGSAVYSCGTYRDEFVWFTTPDKLTIFDYPGRRPVFKLPPPVYINNFSVNGTLHSANGVNEFRYDQNNIVVRFVGLSFKNERLNRYQYRLLENDREWQPMTKQTSVTYGALKPGTYRFEVKAINADGIESSHPAMMTFTILSPFWKQWWFIVSLNVVVIGLIVLAYRYRMNQLLKIERMRRRIASDLHDDVGTNLSSIIMASQIMERKLKLSDEERDQLRQIAQTASHTNEMMRDIVWMLNPQNDTLDDLLLKMKETAPRLLSNVRYTFNAPDQKLLDKVDIEFKRNVFLIFKEALNNVVKHSHAAEVLIDVKQNERMFAMNINDNGVGFDVHAVPSGNGLSNFQRRAELIGGKIKVTSEPGKGTQIKLIVNIT